MVIISVDLFGKIADKDIKRYTLSNDNGTSVQIIEYGAIITSFKVINSKEEVKDIVLGYDTLDDYLHKPIKPYFGAIIGRVANRINNGKFKIDGKDYQVSLNRDVYHLHGGNVGFDKKIWESSLIDGQKVVFSCVSHDGEEGYPGDVTINAIYELNDLNELNLTMTAMTTKPTIVNLTNHSYFNLAGHESGAEGLYEHEVQICANEITAVNENSIPTGELTDLTGTPYDLRIPVSLGDAIKSVPGLGFDHNYCITHSNSTQVTKVARVSHPKSGIVLDVHSNQPGVQFYTSNFLPTDDSLKGKSGAIYKKHAGFCLETQNFPDAINQPKFPSPILRPGVIYKHEVSYWISKM